MIGLRTPVGKVTCKPHFRTWAGLVNARVHLRTAGGTVLVYPTPGGGGSFALSASPAIAYGGRATSGAGPVATESVTVIASPDAAYTYAWAFISSDGGTWHAESPSAATSRFICNSVADGNVFSAVFRCTVTGPGGSVTTDITATVTNYGDLSHAFL